MSVRVMTAVWALDLPDSEKLVLLALADCANDEGHCWPSMASLAKKCSKSDRTVQKCIKALEAAGHLTRNEVPGKGCNYDVHPRSGFTPEAASPPKRTTLTPEAASDKPSRTVSSEDKSSSQRKPWSMPPVPVDAQVWADFRTNRKRKRLSETPTTYKHLMDDLTRVAAETGMGQSELLAECAGRGWGGIYDPRSRGPQSTGPPQAQPFYKTVAAGAHQ